MLRESRNQNKGNKFIRPSQGTAVDNSPMRTDGVIQGNAYTTSRFALSSY